MTQATVNEETEVPQPLPAEDAARNRDVIHLRALVKDMLTWAPGVTTDGDCVARIGAREYVINVVPI